MKIILHKGAVLILMLFFSFASLLFLGIETFAQTVSTDNLEYSPLTDLFGPKEEKVDVSGLNIPIIFSTIFWIIFTISGTIVTVMLVIQGFNLIVAQFSGKVTKVVEVRQKLGHIFVGMAVLLLSFLILQHVNVDILNPKLLGKNEGLKTMIEKLDASSLQDIEKRFETASRDAIQKARLESDADIFALKCSEKIVVGIVSELEVIEDSVSCVNEFNIDLADDFLRSQTSERELKIDCPRISQSFIDKLSTKDNYEVWVLDYSEKYLEKERIVNKIIGYAKEGNFNIDKESIINHVGERGGTCNCVWVNRRSLQIE